MAKVYGGKLNAISRGLRLHRAGMKVLRGGSSLLEMTPIYDGLTTFAEYYANFTPTGSNSTLEIVFYKQGSKIQTIAFGDVSAFSVALDASDVLTFNLISNVELNGVPATSGVTTVPDGYYVLTGDLDITSDIKYYAANATPANFFGIQIHSMKNLDNYDTGRTEYPVNGRDVVELDGLTQYGEISAWNATNGVIEFDFVVDNFNVTKGLIGSNTTENPRVFVENSTGLFKFGGLSDGLLDGNAVTSGSASVIAGKVHRFKASIISPNPVRFVGSEDGERWFNSGFIVNLHLTDLDNPSNSRDYPLNRADIIQDVNGDGSTDGNWVNAPQAVHRPNNSIDINTVKRSKDAPSASDNLLINSLGSVGEELVVNGDFEDGLNGWSSDIGVILSVSNGQMTIDRNGILEFEGQCYQVIPTVAGRVYMFDMDVISETSATRLTLDGVPIADAFDGTPVFFVASSSEAIVDIKVSGSANGLSTVDNISVRETTRNVGELVNLTGWQPVLKGGGLNRENVPDKFEAFNGGYTGGSFVNGVDVSLNLITSEGPVGAPPYGSYEAPSSDVFGVGTISVSSTGAIIQTSGTGGRDVAYTTLQGTDEQIQKGFEYPNIFRVIKPTDSSGEYAWYNAGKPYPWDGKQAPITRAELDIMIANGDDVTGVDTSEMTDFSGLFNGIEVVGDITGWDVSSGTNFRDMFMFTSFNQDISGWNMSNAINIGYMFYQASFNQDISLWDVSNITTVDGLFRDTPFDKDISSWNVGKVVNFARMFSGTPFNVPIGTWDVSSGNDFSHMFDTATSFNQDISGWNVDAATDWRNFSINCPLISANKPPKFR